MDDSLPSSTIPPAKPKRIFLIGPMGSGKSAVGKALARLLKLRFIDSDTEIERRTGVDIPFIFEKEGEAGFREREREALADLTLLDGVVLATGGGAILLPENQVWLRERGTVVYLQASIAEQVKRTQRGRHRPLLLHADPATRLAELMAVREPIYLALAHCSVSTDRRRVLDVAKHIVANLPTDESASVSA